MRLSKWWIDYCIFSFLLLCGNIYSVVCKITYVKREAGVGKHDYFDVSPSPYDCDSNIKGTFYSNAAGSCKCPNGQVNLLNYDKKCVTNSILDQQLNLNSDCNEKLYFTQQGNYGPYNVFDLNSAPSNTSHFKNVVEIQGSSCKVNKIDYIDDFSGMLITLVNSSVFTVNKQSKALSWKTGSAPKRFHGRIIKLTTVNCTFKVSPNQNWLVNPCIVFKTQGKVKVTFPVSLSTISTIGTIKPSILSSLHSTTLFSSKSSVNPSRSQHVITYVSTLVKTTVATTPQPSRTAPVVIFSTTSTFIPVTSSAPSKPADNKGLTDEQSGAPIGAIVGSLAGILVIAIIIILIVVWKRRKRTTTSKTGNRQTHKDNPTYGKNETIDLSKQKQGPKITGNELEYDYAAVDGDPRASNGAAPGIYQSLIKDPNRESVYTPLERQEANQYNKVERAPFKPARNGPTDPTYNVLERPSDNNDDYLEPGSHIDKNKRPHSNLAPQNNEPVYNVLEGPNQEGEDEPEYNVLEDPDGQDDPEYNVLEDPDDNYDNAPVETDRGHPSSHDNVGYASTIDFKKRQGTKNEPVYEAPEGPSSELTYQPLQINSQDNVYQPLDRTSRMIPDDQPVYHVLESQGSEA